MTDFPRLLAALTEGGVRFVIVGEAAATAHGSSRLTFDLDVVYDRDHDNVERLARALSPYRPYLRDVAEGLPFVLDAETIRSGLNFTLTTTIGSIDLLAEIAGNGTYQTLAPRCVTLTLFGHACLVLGLDALIDAKRASGRPKDLDAVAELDALRDEPR